MADELVFRIVVKDDGSSQLGAFDKQLQKTAKDGQRAFDGMAKTITSAFTAANVSIGNFVVDGLKMLGNAFVEMGKMAWDALKSVAEATQKFLLKSIDAYSDFEDAMNGAKRTAGLNEKQMKTLGDATRKLSVETLKGTISAEKLGEILEIAGQTGILTADGFDKNSDAVMKFAKDIGTAEIAMGIGAEKIASQLGKATGVFTKDTKLFADAIGKAASTVIYFDKETNATSVTLMETSKRMALAGKNAGLTQAQVIALSAAMLDVGMTSEVAASSSKRAFDLMKSDSAKVAAAFGLSADSFRNKIATDMPAALTMLAESMQRIRSGPDGMLALQKAMDDAGISAIGTKDFFLALADLGGKLQTKFFQPAARQWQENTQLAAAYEASVGRLSVQFGAFGEIAKEVYRVVGEPLVNALSQLMSVTINPLLVEFTTWLQSSEFIAEIWPAIIADMKIGIETIIGKVREWADLLIQNPNIWRDIKQAGADAYDYILTKAKDFWKWLSENVTSENINKGWTGLTQVWERLAPIAQGALTLIEEKSAALYEFLQKTDWAGVWNEMLTALGTVSDAITGIGDMYAVITGKNEDWKNILKETAVETLVDIEKGLMSPFRKAADEIERGTKATKELTGKIEETTKAGAALEQQMTGGSTLPDMLVGIQANQTAMISLKGATDAVTTSAARLDAQLLANIAHAQQAAAYMEKQLLSQNPTQTGEPTGATTSGTGAAVVPGARTFGDIIEIVGKNGIRTFTNLAREIGTATNEQLGLNIEIAKTADNISRVGDVAYKNSVYPEMFEWMKKVKDAQNSLNVSIDASSNEMQSLINVATGPDGFLFFTGEGIINALRLQRENAGKAWSAQIANWKAQTEEIVRETENVIQGITRNNIGRKISREGDVIVEERGGEARGTRETRATSSESLVVNFNGNNVIDERSLGLFAEKISEVQRKQSSRIIQR